MRVFAPAKVNLALHVTGRRADGYHLLDSLVVFAGAGDWLDISPSAAVQLHVTGPRAQGVPTDRSNLVWQAAEVIGPGRGAEIVLEKHLPHAGGIGGGSADAAAAIRGLSDLWGAPVPELADLVALGADIPVCVHGRPARMRGIGEVLDPVPALPDLWLLLVNPGVEVPTGPVFDALTTRENAPMPDPEWKTADGFFDWLAETRNDLESPAATLVPEVGDALDRLTAEAGCALARMSGSGGTCFGLFRQAAAAQEAEGRLRALHPDWWVMAAPVLRDDAPLGGIS